MVAEIRNRECPIYFSGTNLLTWAAYDQYDPEMSGVVGFYTPPLKTYAFGLELKF